MTRKAFSALIASLVCVTSSYAADTLRINSFRYTAPVKVQTPYMVDTVDNTGASFAIKSILDGPVDFSALKASTRSQILPKASENELILAGFTLQNTGFAKASLKVDGVQTRKLYLDGKALASEELTLEPGTHELSIRYIGSKDDSAPSVNVAVQKGHVEQVEGTSRILSLDLNTIGASCGGASLSPSGELIAIRHSLTDESGKSSSYTEIIRISDNSILVRVDGAVSWMSSTDEYYYTRPTASGRSLICVDPVSKMERVLCGELPQGYYTLAPNEKYLIFSMSKEGPKEGEVHQIVDPEDRQPGYRDRSYLAKYDIATGIMQPLTFGYHNSYLVDITDDSRYMLFMTMENRFGPRPTLLYSYFIMDLETMEVTNVVDKDGFLGAGAAFSPDGKKVAFIGSPEAFGGVGMNLPAGRTPNMYDYQLFVKDLASGKVTPLTKSFAPGVQSIDWNRYDDKIYLLAENGDRRDLFRVDAKTAKSEKLPNTEDYVYGFSMSRTAPVMAYYGESLDGYRKVYLIDTKKKKESMFCDFTSDRLPDVTLGKGYAYECKNSAGDRITAFYVLPPDFDSSKKYPVIVHYYGGCSPTLRYCLGSYSPQLYAAQGYIFLAINPSGASGFGQEFASRHVNTAGEGVAQDIIECTEQFCKDNQWADKDHIGCFSASYGGFMTQLLLTKTDMFATGISHAGISDHTSYWGEGYWGYSYSEVSMANSYPWTRKDLYVDRSTLFHADEIHTPLLFLHGSADTNVPIGESIQMFTALKLLGQDTAFVVVDGEDHHITEFNKHRQWLRTISAWFAKYLKEDSTWWDELYPEKHL